MTTVERNVTIRLTRTDVAETLGISVTRLVKYERIGLVSPTVVDRRPRYGPEELARLRKIRRLTDDLGVNLAGVEIIMRLLDQMADPESRQRR
ncbi:MAG TPA: chaperone modulator CbpM [Chloroflexota bacterium]|jgi:MerR family transcriptional regulator/heat shock protein HspR|nr:chaperone modulator CbpM [Chloroflexota bacterium]